MPGDLPETEVFERTLRGPDGNDYRVAMQGQFWNCMEWLAGENWPEATLVRLAWSAATEVENNGEMTGSFEYHLAQCLQGVIYFTRQAAINKEAALANDNLDELVE